MLERFKKELLLHSTNGLTLDEERNLAAKRMYLIHNMKLFTTEKAIEDVRKPGVMLKNLMNLDPSTTIKVTITYGMFINVLRSLGTERHYKYLERALDGDVSLLLPSSNRTL